jgi:hypothetical protein
MTFPWPIYLPPIESFRIWTVDILHFFEVPNPHTTLAYGNLPILLTGTWLEGHRGKVAVTDAYDHVALVDPTIAVIDNYTGQGQANPADPDRVVIPGTGNGSPNFNNINWWFCSFSFQTILPGIGRKRVVLLDRQGSANWPGIP